jgi:hypothetical protein
VILVSPAALLRHLIGDLGDARQRTLGSQRGFLQLIEGLYVLRGLLGGFAEDVTSRTFQVNGIADRGIGELNYLKGTLSCPDEDRRRKE